MPGIPDTGGAWRIRLANTPVVAKGSVVKGIFQTL
jgi:hypothetical protein